MFQVDCLHSKEKYIADHANKYMVLPLELRLKIPIPKQNTILSPWLLESSLNMIYAWRGVGKTYVALGIAYAVASGGNFLNWNAENSKGVLYIDGEMPSQVLNNRLKNTISASDQKNYPKNTLWIFGIDLHDEVMPDLGTEKGQKIVDQYIETIPDLKLIIIDNLSCLLRSGGCENDAESWRKISSWALRKRAQGFSLIFVHHSGKDGAQRGTSKKEDILDTVIALKHPYDYAPSQGARFEVHFEKSRHSYGENVKPFITRLDTENDNCKWIIGDLPDSNKHKVIQMYKEGLSVKEIATDLGISRQAVHKHLKNL